MRLARTERFKSAWRQLDETEKALGKKAIENLLHNPRYPSLRVKKIKGFVGIWEARVSRNIRITFEISQDTIVLRNIGAHDETLGNP